MKPLKSVHILAGLIIVLICTLSFSSCATTRANRIETQKRGLMIQDKSQYTMNKKFKGNKGKSFKKLKKKSKRMKRRR